MIIQSKRVFLHGRFEEAQIDIADKRIKEIHPYGCLPADIDYGDKRIVPGFYDIHTHGYKGFDTNDGNEEGLRTWLKEIPAEGVCGICPTTITQSHEVLSKALKNVTSLSHKEYEGARILGIHLEGPYLDKGYKGAQPEEYCITGTIEELEEYLEDSDHLIRIVTLAPEHDIDFRLIRYCAKHGINASLGHSSASYECAREAVENGARGFTHTFNAMSPFTHRENGMVGASLLSDECYSELICDRYHSSTAAKKLFFRCKPSDKAVMISDALMMKGLPAGTKTLFGGQEVIVMDGGDCRLTENGKLAGSTLRINEGLKLLVEEAGLSFEKAILTCTINPMRYLGIEDRGLLEKGYYADIVILNEDYSVEDTYAEGKRVFFRD